MKAYKIVTIEREYASGGSEIGKKVAEKLGVPVYGKELLEYIAQKAGVSPANIEGYEEKTTNSLLYSLHILAETFRGEMPGASYSDRLNNAEQELIKKVADHTDCVIVGRCAGWALKDRTDTLDVFITADKAFRKRRAVEQYGVAENQAEQVLSRVDRQRTGFYRSITGRDWHGRPDSAMILDSGKLGIDACAEIICQTAKGFC